MNTEQANQNNLMYSDICHLLNLSTEVKYLYGKKGLIQYCQN